MAFEQKIGLSRRLQQTLVITPQLKHAIKILQLSRADLEQLVTEEMEQNPTLEELSLGQEDAEVEMDSATPDDRMPELVDPTEQATEAPAHEEQAAEIDPGESNLGDINWEEYLSDYAANTSHGSLSAGSGGDFDEDKRPTLENTLTRASSLADHLTWQLRMGGDFSSDDREIGDVFIGNVDENGYLQISVEDAAFEAGVDAETALVVLRRMQRFDPPGVFARDLRECLLIQLDQLELEEPLKRMAREIVESHLSLVEAKRFDKLSKELRATRDETTAAVKVISSLEPKPGRNFVTEEVRYVTPDVFVNKMDGEYVVSLNDDGLPKLRVSNSYRRLLSDENGGSEAKIYIREKLSAAQWLIRSIHQRQSTLFKVTSSIVRFQRSFFDHGVKALRPLVLKDVAGDIGMHESTVSRATANKYVHTPQGTLELKYFFTSSIRSSDGEGVSAESVKEKIKKIIESEDARRPYSDQHIAETLAAENIEIARRTVAKYREIMGILPSSRRRQMA
ncbi:MAG: RNA polymerase factor sigma-54 [Deltaproteobacteria bacterium]|nr:RNA polymerase factor sigma-54 [Deltaproteobacteria bacterium]